MCNIVDGRTVEARVSAIEPERYRAESADELWIEDWTEGAGLTLNKRDRIGTRLVLQGRPLRIKSLMTLVIQELEKRRRAGGKPELGREVIDQHHALGFRLDMDGWPVDVWTDAMTYLPIRIQWKEGNGRIVIDQIESAAPVDVALFRIEPPPGYRLLDRVVTIAGEPGGVRTETATENDGVGRSSVEVEQKAMAARDEVMRLLPSMLVLVDPDKRAAVAPRALAALRTVMESAERLPQGNQMRNWVDGRRYLLLAQRMVLGDADAAAQLKRMSQQGTAEESLQSRMAWQLAQWWLFSSDSAAQSLVADAMEVIARSHRDSDLVVDGLMSMVVAGAATTEMQHRIERIVTTEMTGKRAERAAAWIAERAKERQTAK